MIKTIVPAHQETVERLVQEYQYIDLPSAGFIFDYMDGKTVFKCKEAARNYTWCNEHPELVINKGLKTITNIIQVPAYVECDCGERFYLHDSYYGCCQCSQCGIWYSLFGQEMNYIGDFLTFSFQ